MSASRFPVWPRDFALLFAALAVWLGFSLGGRGLNAPDEGRLTSIALDFLAPGASWWEPRMSGFGHYDKPPLVYWATAAAIKTFGRNETAARLPSACGAMLALIGVGWAAGRLHGRRVAWWAILITGTLTQFWALARFLTPDMLFTGWSTLAIAAWAEARSRNGDRRFWLLSLLFWTLAWWTKATPVLVLCAGLAVAIAVQNDVAGKAALRLRWLVPAILALGSPWFVLMMVEHRELVGFFFGRELIGRVAGHVDGRRGPFYYYAALSWGAWLPWAPALAATLYARRDRFRFQGWPWLARALGLEGWIVLAGLIIFSCVSSKLPTYTLPLAPWAGLFMARILLKLQGVISARAFRWLTVTPIAAIGLLGVTVAEMAPRVESGLGLNSSVRETAAWLRAHGTQSIYVDSYWPALEFYFGEEVRYVTPIEPRQRTDDSGVCGGLGDRHFFLPTEWEGSLPGQTGKNVWLVRYNRARNSPFDARLRRARPFFREQTIIGDFWLARIQ